MLGHENYNQAGQTFFAGHFAVNLNQSIRLLTMWREVNEAANLILIDFIAIGCCVADCVVAVPTMAMNDVIEARDAFWETFEVIRYLQEDSNSTGNSTKLDAHPAE